MSDLLDRVNAVNGAEARLAAGVERDRVAEERLRTADEAGRAVREKFDAFRAELLDPTTDPQRRTDLAALIEAAAADCRELQKEYHAASCERGTARTERGKLEEALDVARAALQRALPDPVGR